MNQLEALKESIAMARERGHDNSSASESPHAITVAHFQSMLDRVLASPEVFSEAKLGRWLGYVQGVMVALGTATLDDIKQINQRHAG